MFDTQEMSNQNDSFERFQIFQFFNLYEVEALKGRPKAIGDKQTDFDSNFMCAATGFAKKVFISIHTLEILEELPPKYLVNHTICDVKKFMVFSREISKLFLNCQMLVDQIERILEKLFDCQMQFICSLSRLKKVFYIY